MRALAFLFPGQGSQSASMFDDFARHPQVAAAAREVGDALDLDLPALARDDAARDDTANTQPLMLAADVGAYRAWRAAGGAAADAFAGHSLGEYAALVCADAIDLAAAAILTRERGLAMRAAQAEEPGAMAALAVDADGAARFCAELRAAGFRIWAANFNSPQQTVVAGDAAAIDAALEKSRAFGIRRATKLAVGAPSHCPLLAAAAARFAAAARVVAWRLPRAPVWQNATARAPVDAGAMSEALIAQLTAPVLWTQTIAALARDVDAFFECGPGKALAGLARRIAPATPIFSLSDSDAIDAAAREWRAAAAPPR